MEAAIISAAVALIIFSGSILFHGKQRRHELLVQKLEELMISLENVINKAMHIDENGETQTASIMLTEAIQRPQMLAYFYFELIPDIREITLKATALAKQHNEIGYLLKKHANDTITNSDKPHPVKKAYEQRSKQIMDVAKSIFKFRDKIRADYRELTEPVDDWF